MKPGGIILAGGKSSRMGKGVDKLQKHVTGVSLLDNAITILKDFCDPILVVGRDLFDERKYNSVHFTHDEIPLLGPMGGIYTGLTKTNKSSNIVIAADMPF